MNGQLWVIEGADGSGKATQAKLLAERLNKSRTLGENLAHYWPFPTYEDEVWGKLIKEYLTNAAQKAMDVDPYYAALLYAADRGKAAMKLRPLLEKGHWIICDRYIQSNMAFQGAKIENIKDRDNFVNWLEQKEYEYFNVPQANGVIYLNLPIEVSQARIAKRLAEAQAKGMALGHKVKDKDIHEQDVEYMKSVMDEYLRLAKIKGWHVINGLEDGRELTPQEVSDRIWSMVEKNI